MREGHFFLACAQGRLFWVWVCDKRLAEGPIGEWQKEQRRAVKRDAAAVRGAGAGWWQRSTKRGRTLRKGKGKGAGYFVCNEGIYGAKIKGVPYKGKKSRSPSP